jgi:kelch-like protein 10
MEMEVDSDSDTLQIIPQGSSRCRSPPCNNIFNDLREKNLLCDAVLRLEDGGTFPVHRVILSTCSAYFKTIFTTTLHSKEERDILLHGVSSETIRLILGYIYERKVDINEENVGLLLVFADYLSVLGLLELCCDFLRGMVALENCVRIMLFARYYFCSSLEWDARCFVMSNFVQVSQQTNELLELPLEELQAIIEADELNVKSEEVVWDCVLRWINYDAANRKDHIAMLIKRVRLGLLDSQFFLEHVVYHPYVARNEKCRPVITDTLHVMYDLETENLTPELSRPRIPHEILFAIGGWREHSATNYMQTYDARAGRWVEVEEVDPAGPRGFHGTAVIGFNIYVIGGSNGTRCLNSCRCFNAVSKTWSEVSPMHESRCYVSVALLDELVYAMGGYDGHDRHKTAERYDHQTNQWYMIASMNEKRSDASAAMLNGNIYIAGGYNGLAWMKSAEVYDPVFNQWTFIQEMNYIRSGVSCISYHGHVYAIGGFDDISRKRNGEKYNPTTNLWTEIPDMHKSRSNFGIEVIDDMIFVIGGHDTVTTFSNVECYDGKSNKWFEVRDINISEAGVSACVIKGLPNVRDYIRKQTNRLMVE